MKKNITKSKIESESNSDVVIINSLFFIMIAAIGLVLSLNCDTYGTANVVTSLTVTNLILFYKL